jgi:hypothetical protein
MVEETRTQETETGLFAEEVYENLPMLIRSGTERLAGHERAVFLVGSLAAMSSALPNITAIYDGQALESNLFVFLVGGFGSGKGVLSFVYDIIQPIHKHLRETEQPPGEDGQQPERRLHIIPANVSKSGIIELLATNKRGLIFDTEADTLTYVFKLDFGSFDDILRKSYHHESLPFYRRANREYFEVERPKLSVLLSGTENQLKKLIPGIENGLFSRFMYYRLEANHEFKNVFSSNGGLSGYFHGIGLKVLDIYKLLAARTEPLMFRFTNNQKEQFLQYFSKLKPELTQAHGEPMAGLVNRFAVQFTRIAMTLSGLRLAESPGLPTEIFCSDIDFENTRQIFEVFMHHALTIYENLEENQLPENKKQFIDRLPKEFTTQQALEVGQALKIHVRTVKRFIKNKQYFTNSRHGHYLNTTKKTEPPQPKRTTIKDINKQVEQ